MSSAYQRLKRELELPQNRYGYGPNLLVSRRDLFQLLWQFEQFDALERAEYNTRIAEATQRVEEHLRALYLDGRSGDSFMLFDMSAVEELIKERGKNEIIRREIGS